MALSAEHIAEALAYLEALSYPRPKTYADPTMRRLALRGWLRILGHLEPEVFTAALDAFASGTHRFWPTPGQILALVPEAAGSVTPEDVWRFIHAACGGPQLRLSNGTAPRYLPRSTRTSQALEIAAEVLGPDGVFPVQAALAACGGLNTIRDTSTISVGGKRSPLDWVRETIRAEAKQAIRRARLGQAHLIDVHQPPQLEADDNVVTTRSTS